MKRSSTRATTVKHIQRLSDLTPDNQNANAGTERGAYMVEQSLSQYGAGRSILADKHGVVIAGNKTLEAAAGLGLEVEEVHTTGDKLVVVVRDDLDLTTDERARQLAYADNRASEVGLQWSAEQLLKDAQQIDLSALFKPGEIEAIKMRVDPEPPEFAEYDESAADDVEMCTCPKCGHVFPK